MEDAAALRAARLAYDSAEVMVELASGADDALGAPAAGETGGVAAAAAAA
jgi:hypothetical protein